MDTYDELDSQFNVLLIEDDLGDVDLVRRYLSKCSQPHFKVENVQSLQEAVERVASGRFDAVLLDLNLPDSCGLESVDLLLSVWESGPIIVLTGLEENCIGLDAMRHGAQDFLTKDSLSANLLSRTIRYAVERHFFVHYLETIKKSNEEFLTEFITTTRDSLSELLVAASDLCTNPQQDQLDRVTECGSRMVDSINQASRRPGAPLPTAVEV